MMCGQSWSPEERHTAYFAWDGGATVEAVACSTRCETVVSLPASSRLAYRWIDADLLEIMDARRAEPVGLTRIGDLEVRTAPYDRAQRDSYHVANLDRSSCSAVEDVVIDD